MKLLLPIPSSWEQRPAQGRELYLVAAASPQVTLEVGPIVTRPELPDNLLSFGLREDQRMIDVRELAHRTMSGWPMKISAGVRTTASGAVLESRLVVAYTFIVYATAVLASSPDPARLELHRDEILRVLELARPELRRDVPAAISELWSMEDAL